MSRMPSSNGSESRVNHSSIPAGVAGDASRLAPRPRFSGALPLWIQLSLAPLLLGILVMVLAGTAYYLATKDQYLQQSEQQLLTVATLSAENLNDLLNERVRVVRTLATDVRLLDALREDPNRLENLDPAARQQRLAALDQAWRQLPAAAPTDSAGAHAGMPPVLAERVGNPTAAFLKSHQTLFPGVYGEIFLTDRFGALIAATGRLTTLAHAHKYWWKAAYADGRGQIYLDDRGFDESVGDIVLGVVVPVHDGGEILGIIKANILVRDLVRLVEAADPSLQFAVVRSSGRVLLEQGPKPLSTNLSAAEAALMARREPVSASIASAVQAMVVAVAPIELTLSDPDLGFGGRPTSPDVDHRGGNAGEYWGLMVRRFVGVDDVLGMSPGGFALLASFVLAVAVPISGWFGWRLARPIDRMAARIEGYTPGGDLEPNLPVRQRRGSRELQRLDAAFVDMAGRIAKQAVSIDILAAEVGRRQRAEAEQRKLLAELKRSNEELGKFAYVASHDLQEPLRMVSSYLQLIERRYSATLDDKGRQFIGYAVDGARRMKGLIQDLLALSRVTTHAHPPEDIDANQVLEQVLQDLRASIDEHDARVQTEQLPMLRADPTQLRQLMQNLIGNAIKFRHPDRSPIVRITARPCIETGTAGKLLVVSDNGIGIASDYFDRIFEVFQRLHTRDAYSGTGIGLAVCKKIAERHGGWIRVSSEPGAGSRFEVFVPDQPPPFATGVDDE